MTMVSEQWDQRYLDLAKQIAGWSKDPSRKIGAVAVGDKGQVLSQGYNGFPRGILDSSSRYDNRDMKYKYVVHAEMNVIYNAGYSGVSLSGSTLYVYGLPVCSECAKGVIQTGIKRIVMSKQSFDAAGPWSDSWFSSRKLFEECNVKWKFI